jgi:hypothetical protein
MWTSAVFESGLARALGTDLELRFKHIKASLQAIERLSKTVPVTRYALIPRSKTDSDMDLSKIRQDDQRESSLFLLF